MKLPSSEHSSRPWRIHEIARGFRLLDVWALPTPGGRDDFPRLVEGLLSFDPAQISSLPVRMLFDVRQKLGEWLRLDEPDSGLGSRVASLRERVPAELADIPANVRFATLPASPLYVCDDEFAAEVANKTVHGVIHLGWVETEPGGYRGQLSVLTRTNGLFGSAYVAAIAPFRHLLVYPVLIAEIAARWEREKELQPRG